VDGILVVHYFHPTDTFATVGLNLKPLSSFLIPAFLPTFTQYRPTQLHPNSWASLQVFRLVCDMFRLRPSTQTFLHCYSSHSTDAISWLSLTSQSDNILLAPYASSYKYFKGKIFKVYIEPEGKEFFFDSEGRSKFPFHWTKSSIQYK